ncbi:MAG: sigma-70 family RNA polymerase sigma factor [Anaerolineae bacterium]
MDDTQLIAAILRRDQDAMVALHARYADLIYSIGYRILNDSGTAEECVQDVFMRVWQNTSQYDSGRGSLVAWLVGIARNIAIDKLRQRGRQVTVDDRDGLDDSDRLAAAAMPENWRDREHLDALRLQMKELPDEQYQALYLAYFGGMSQSDIAEHLNLPLGTVKTRMRLGMQKLRDAWLDKN